MNYRLLITVFCWSALPMDLAAKSMQLPGDTCTLNVALLSTNVSCFGLANGLITADPSGGTPAYTFQWSTGDATPAVDSLFPGMYTVTVTDSAGCTATATGTITEPPPYFPVLYITFDSAGQGQGAIDLDIGGAQPPYTYSWTMNGQPFSTQEDLMGLMAGNYAVTITDSRGCTGYIDDIVIEDVSATGEPVWLAEVSLFPNPASTLLEIHWSGAVVVRQLDVFDAAGHSVIVMRPGSERGLSIDCTAWPVGMYRLRIQTVREVGWKWFVVRR
jgi:hypothetical protein